MRTPGLQYLYLQKPLTLILLIAALSTLPWIGMGDYYTKGEPREAAVAVSILNGDYIIPQVYADELAYKPPLMHWLMAAFSIPQGEVSPFTSRLPSALSFIIMVGACFIFFGRKLHKGHEGFMACLVMITCFELHRAAMTSRVDMLLSTLMVTGMIGLFFWAEDKKMKGLPWYIPLLLGGAALVKGPVGIVLPLMIFGIYLLATRCKFSVILWKLSLVGLLSLIPLFTWYYLAYLKEGQEFVNLAWAENFGRFFGLKNLNIHYNLGQEFPRYYNILYLLSGFIPWTLLLLFSLFGLKIAGKFPGFKAIGQQLLSMNRVRLFSLIAAVTVFVFYCIPISRRSVYLMPAYPFIALFIAQYALYLGEYRSKVLRAFAWFSAGLFSLVILICMGTLTGIIKPDELLAYTTHHHKTLHDASLFTQALSTMNWLYALILLGLVYSVGILIYQLRKKNQLKILYAAVGVYFAFNLLMDGVMLPEFKSKSSIKPFITELKSKYTFTKDNVYVMNNLLEYGNLYGPNFYMGNIFHNFDKERPSEGYLFSFPGNMERMQEVYKDEYQFVLLEQSPTPYNDVRNHIQLYRIERKTLR